MDDLNKWQIKKVSFSSLKESKYNPRKIDQENLEALENSLSRFGYVEPIVWNERTGNIVGGHQRYKILESKGIKDVFVVVVNMSEEDEVAANLTLNNPHIQGTWDDPISGLLNDIRIDDFDLFGSLNFDNLSGSVERKISSKVDQSDNNLYDTECPCCGYEWNITEDDIKL